jgi:hypothetical protein
MNLKGAEQEGVGNPTGHGLQHETGGNRNPCANEPLSGFLTCLPGDLKRIRSAQGPGQKPQE